MKRNTSSQSYHDDKLEKSRREDYNHVQHSRTEEEKLNRRRKWLIQQELMKEHEKLKQKMILNYELKRAREKHLQNLEGRSSHRSRSKSRSKSRPRSRSLERLHRRKSMANSSTSFIMSKKLDSSNGTVPIFKGPEGTQISVSELRHIKVDIHRNIPQKGTCGELLREIINPDDVLLKRREGEGARPIFEREEIKRAASKVEEVEEHRTVIAINNKKSDDKVLTQKKHSVFGNTEQKYSQSQSTSSHHSRFQDSKHSTNDSGCYRSSRKTNSKERSRNVRERYKGNDIRNRGRSRENDRFCEQNKHRDRSQSKEKEERKRERDTHHRLSEGDRLYREYRERSRDCSRDRRQRERGIDRKGDNNDERESYRNQRIQPPRYIEQVPVPIYYGNFHPRPILVGPVLPIRGQVPLIRGRPPPMMGPIRPFPPRFVPTDMYRLGPPPNPRFGPMF